VLAVQALFPVTSATEMAGQPGENTQADLAATGDLPALWDHLARKLAAIDGYVELFEAAFPDEVSGPGDLTFVQAANAIAAFESKVWRFTDSPFDRFVRGERDALSGSALRGMRLFYGKADCGRCHSGLFQTDHEFHAIAMPQIGGGKGDGFDGREDFGRERVSGDADDRFRFRTPTLRNVAQSGPWGHAGAYDSLEAVVKHHLDPIRSLRGYDRDQAFLPGREDLDALDFVVMSDPARVREIAAANELEKQRLSRREFDDLIDFLHALGDPAALDMRSDLPKSVPSGLPLAD
jgi:cytochrome c peroxidase